MRRLVVIIATALLLLGMALPVSATDMSFYRADYKSLQFDWIQLDRDANGDRLPPMESRPFGNVHIGFVFAQELSTGSAFVFGQIADLNCPVDFIPPPTGGHGVAPAEEPENPCEHIGIRQIQGEGIPFTADSKLTTARLGGVGVTVGIFGGGDPHGGGGVLLANVPINVTFTGAGALAKSTFTDRFTDGTTSFSARFTSLTRQGELTGVLGPMGFDPDLSGGSLSHNKESQRSRTR
jgi:hypothetical protein